MMKNASGMFMAGLGLAALLGCQHREVSKDTSDDFHPALDMPQEEEAQTPASIPDQDFLIQAAQANLAEVELGRLAQRNATNADVRSFALHMTDDHSALMAELTKLAQKKGVRLPTGPDEAYRKNAAWLSEKRGGDFDREYIRMMVADHVQAVSLFEGEAERAADPDVCCWAESTLPTLRDHLEMARDLEDEIGGQGLPD
jgi:putative membrane protein